jgi:sulfate permease, SulP family
MIRIYQRGGRELILVAASAALVVVPPIQTGMLLTIIRSFIHSLFIVSLFIVARPPSAVLARVSGSTVWWPPSPEQAGEQEPGVLVFAPAVPINFTNAQHIAETIRRELGRARQPVELLVIEASGIIDVDYTGSQILQQMIADLRERGIAVALARLSDVRARPTPDAPA